MNYARKNAKSVFIWYKSCIYAKKVVTLQREIM